MVEKTPKALLQTLCKSLKGVEQDRIEIVGGGQEKKAQSADSIPSDLYSRGIISVLPAFMISPAFTSICVLAGIFLPFTYVPFVELRSTILNCP